MGGGSKKGGIIDPHSFFMGDKRKKGMAYVN